MPRPMLAAESEADSGPEIAPRFLLTPSSRWPLAVIGTMAGLAALAAAGSSFSASLGRPHPGQLRVADFDGVVQEVGEPVTSKAEFIKRYPDIFKITANGGLSPIFDFTQQIHEGNIGHPDVNALGAWYKKASTAEKAEVDKYILGVLKEAALKEIERAKYHPYSEACADAYTPESTDFSGFERGWQDATKNAKLSELIDALRNLNIHRWSLPPGSMRPLYGWMVSQAAAQPEAITKARELMKSTAYAQFEEEWKGATKSANADATKGLMEKIQGKTASEMTGDMQDKKPLKDWYSMNEHEWEQGSPEYKAKADDLMAETLAAKA